MSATDTDGLHNATGFAKEKGITWYHFVLFGLMWQEPEQNNYLDSIDGPIGRLRSKAKTSKWMLKSCFVSFTFKFSTTFLKPTF